MPYNAAVGFTGNFGVESRYDPGINEIAPLVEGSRGGFGLPQWTGPRRRQFEAYAGDKVADLDTQLDFLMHELATTERSARDAIYSARDPIEAARLVSSKFLRPGIPHLDRRIEETRKLMGQNYGPSTQERPSAPTHREPQRNQLAQQPEPQRPNPLQLQNPMSFQNSLNVDAFRSATPVNALRSFTDL